MSKTSQSRTRIQLHFDPQVEPSRTLQSASGECDINQIMARFQRTGLVNHVNQRQSFYGDFSTVPDYQEALLLINSANNMFASLPSSLRARFDNDPAKYIAFVSDPANSAELSKLGLLKATQPPVEPSAGHQSPQQKDPSGGTSAPA